MNEKICVRVPVSRPFTTIVFSPPCVYCGRPVADGLQPVIKEFPITIRRWERDPETGRMELREARDEQANSLQGTIRLRLPYCAEHIPVPQPIRLIQSLGTILTVLVTLHCVLNPLATWQFDNWLEALCFAIAAPILLFYPLQFLFTTLPRSLFVRFNRGLRDFHYATGHWGLSAVTGFECGQPGSGPVRYPVYLTFSNPASAHRFHEAHPEAEIVIKNQRTQEFMEQ